MIKHREPRAKISKHRWYFSNKLLDTAFFPCVAPFHSNSFNSIYIKCCTWGKIGWGPNNSTEIGIDMKVGSRVNSTEKLDGTSKIIGYIRIDKMMKTICCRNKLVEVTNVRKLKIKFKLDLPLLILETAVDSGTMKIRASWGTRPNSKNTMGSVTSGKLNSSIEVIRATSNKICFSDAQQCQIGQEAQALCLIGIQEKINEKCKRCTRKSRVHVGKWIVEIS